MIKQLNKKVKEIKRNRAIKKVEKKLFKKVIIKAQDGTKKEVCYLKDNRRRTKIKPEIVRAMAGEGSFTWDGKENLANLVINKFKISEIPHKKYIHAYVNGYIEKRIKIMKKMSKIIKNHRYRWRLYIHSICTYTIKVAYNNEEDTYNLTYESIFVTPDRIYVKCTGRCYRFNNFSKEE